MSDPSGGWFLTHGDSKVHGPYEMPALVEAARQGNIMPGTQLRHETYTQGQWLPAIRIRPLAEVLRGEDASEPSSPSEPTRVGNDKTPSSLEPVAGSTAPEHTPASASRGDPRTPARSDPRTPARSDPRTPARGDPRTPVHPVSLKPAKVGMGRDPLVVPETLGQAFFSLFDFRFRYFVTPWIIKVAWAFFVTLALIGLVVFTLVFLLQPITQSAQTDLSDVEINLSDPNAPSPAASSGAWQFQPPSLVSENSGRVVAYVVTVVYFGLMLLFLRMALELALVLFRIAVDLREVKTLMHEKE
ncbi:MAG: DUF4282 domain-containing protein [Pirellulales bacterium]|nr:DUF4282 domain-containing protein [Pirellulales bacterium]